MSTLMMDNTKIQEFREALRGELILEGDLHYEDARKVYNAMIDKRPAMIAKCVDVADVITAVHFGRNNKLLTAVRSGGHNGGGLGICDEGLVIDLSGIKYIRVNTANDTVRVGGGNLWGEVDHATHAFGLAVPAGIISTTGVGGLTLGGGVGYLSRKFGLTIDNLLEADIVLADGKVITANKDQNADIFWAIRGGGGNFGIITSFLFQAHKIKNVIGGPTLWPIEKTEEIIAWYDKFIDRAPEDLSGFIATMVIPGPPFPEPLHKKKFCGIVWCYTGDPKNFKKLFEPVLKLEPVFEHVGELPYPTLQTLFDKMMPPGLQWYWRGDFFDEISADAAKVHLTYGGQTPTPLSQMHLYPINGKAAKPGSSDTAWAYRNAKYSGVIVGVDPDHSNAELITSWCKSYWDALHPHSMGGAYSNFMMDEGQERIKASFKHNYKRLQEIKTKYDPNNFFRVNQNIKPA
ncbi:FAD-binding oxidoreductase [Christiangramia salexigens]|uniref:Oxidoreductase n=1 Tax=Christiangramia salexigens TaxID=1913577 RepID=A0A1L3J1Q4_9FLAO|nr:FAD-binding oxidoreductase [Christiangramia salexigens]APG59051.1 oxidoreductase [Christiangramia salexigens]